MDNDCNVGIQSYCDDNAPDMQQSADGKSTLYSGTYLDQILLSFVGGITNFAATQQSDSGNCLFALATVNTFI